jgi:cardiolipin synthase
MNLPNLLTILRLLLIPVFLYFLFKGLIAYALAAFVIAGLTDALDGALARMTGQITELGIFLDPVADKALVLSAFLALLLLHTGRLPPKTGDEHSKP